MIDRTSGDVATRIADRVPHVDGYHELVRIGEGGLGDVYRATRSATGDVVAIKMLRDVSDHTVAWHRTRRELTALVALAGHDHVIRLLELVDLPEGPALVMEYAPGGSVAELLRRRNGTLDIGEVVLVGRHTSAALVAAHARGIVHRDVKPQNLLIDASGRVKLCDFGVAALTGSEEFRTRTGALSMRYASPEDLDDETDVGPPADIYSLGATLLHLARGAPPSLKERLAPWQPPGETVPELAALDTILSDCLHPDPDRRPTASALLDRLDRVDGSLDDRRRRLVAGEPTTGADAAQGAPVDPPIGRRTREGSRSAIWSAPDADTAVRPDADRPDLPIDPMPRRVRRRWPSIAALAGLTVIAVIAVAGVLRSLDESPEPSEPPAGSSSARPTERTDAVDPLSLVARPAGLTPIDHPSIVWPFGRPGDCLVQRPDVDELATVACTEPHDLQRYARATLDQFSSDESYGAAVVRSTVRVACGRAFESFAGTTVDESALDVAFTHPSATTWADGDRQYQCLAGVPGSRVIGDATGSGS